jgi:hypothetical protein
VGRGGIDRIAAVHGVGARRLRRLAPDFLKKEQGPRRSIDAVNLSTESDQAQRQIAYVDGVVQFEVWKLENFLPVR